MRSGAQRVTSVWRAGVSRVAQLFSRNIVAFRKAAGGGEVLFLVEDEKAHVGGGGAAMEEEVKADEGETQGDADVSARCA